MYPLEPLCEGGGGGGGTIEPGERGVWSDEVWSDEVKPLTLRLSAALIRLVRLTSGTEVSPLYMKSTMH